MQHVESFRIPRWMALRALFSLSVLAVGLCWTPSPVSAHDGPKLLISNGSVDGEMFKIGDDLFVEANSAAPGSLLKVYLYDDFGTQVSRVALPIHADGNSSIHLLWRRSGVVGCDDSNEGPSRRAYLFDDFNQAEAQLNGRVFRVEARNDRGRVVAETQVPLSPSFEPRFYFSDSRACPRYSFYDEEIVYLSGRNTASGPTGVYFVDQEKVLSAQGVILEIRQPYLIDPQVVLSQSGSWTVPLWFGEESRPGNFGAIVRTRGVMDFQSRPGDIGVGSLPGKGAGDGITIQVGCNLDDPC